MKRLEKAKIIQLHDNMLSKDNPIVSVDIEYENTSAVQGTYGYTGNFYTNFLKNIMTILEIEEKNQMLEQEVLACTEMDRLLALGNKAGNQWINLKNPKEIINGDIIEYLEKIEGLER